MASPIPTTRALAFFALLWAPLAAAAVPEDCPPYYPIANSTNTANSTRSKGKYALPYQRPESRCRTFAVPEVEEMIEEMRAEIADPDLFRLFENTFPSTLDTTISWKGVGQDEDEELTFIRTGDIDAMWLRDSADQLQSYTPLLHANSSTDSLASLFRGAINLQGRYIRDSPHCNAFQPPPESGLEYVDNPWAASDLVVPAFNESAVFECKYELDSLAAFLQLSHEYFSRTGDSSFFKREGGEWADTVRTILNVTSELLIGTYASDGAVNESPFQFKRSTDTGSETMWNNGAGAPVRADTGLVRSFFRPSDDACMFQLFVPANMMFARYLEACVDIMEELDCGTAEEMKEFAEGIRAGIETYGRVKHEEFGEMYAFEVDGYGSHNLMDDSNIPSLLSAPMLGYLDRNDSIYQNTRRFILSTENPYYMFGPVLNATGGPHAGPGMAWPMGLITQILTSDDDAEIEGGIRQLLSSTDGQGLMHESVNSHDETEWTRSWFAWVNGLFGQMMLDLKDRKPHLLRLSYQ